MFADLQEATVQNLQYAGNWSTFVSSYGTLREAPIGRLRGKFEELPQMGMVGRVQHGPQIHNG